MAKGRKRKAGERTKAGRLSRAKIDYGNARTEAKVARYGTDGTDAIGRAYRCGLLGNLEDNGDTAKRMLDAGRALGRAYWATLPGGPDQRAKEGGIADDEIVYNRERWLLATLGKVASYHRAAFDGLVIDINPDQGPSWLDRLISGHNRHSDMEAFSAALSALAEIANVSAPDAWSYFNPHRRAIMAAERKAA